MPVSLHFDTFGPKTGRPVILIHGWPLSGKSWQHQVGPLAEAGFQVIAYDRRGFGASDKTSTAYDYDSLARDVADLIKDRQLKDVSLVGFSMGGGEVARYVGNYGTDGLHSVVFASAVPPYLMKTADNPDGPLTEAAAAETEQALRSDRAAFFDDFTKKFFSAHGKLVVSEAERQNAIALCQQADQTAALACMKSFGTTDFRADLAKVTVPTLVLHGDADAIVPLPGSGARTHKAIAHSQMVVLPGAPHGCNVSHAAAFNAALIDFLKH